MQESGVPNVTGQLFSHRLGVYNEMQYFGIIEGYNSGPNGSMYDTSEREIGIKINLNKASNQFVNNLNEVRVKSIISNGYILSLIHI